MQKNKECAIVRRISEKSPPITNFLYMFTIGIKNLGKITVMYLDSTREASQSDTQDTLTKLIREANKAWTDTDRSKKREIIAQIASLNDINKTGVLAIANKMIDDEKTLSAKEKLEDFKKDLEKEYDGAKKRYETKVNETKKQSREGIEKVDMSVQEKAFVEMLKKEPQNKT